MADDSQKALEAAQRKYQVARPSVVRMVNKLNDLLREWPEGDRFSRPDSFGKFEARVADVVKWVEDEERVMQRNIRDIR